MILLCDIINLLSNIEKMNEVKEKRKYKLNRLFTIKALDEEKSINEVMSEAAEIMKVSTRKLHYLKGAKESDTSTRRIITEKQKKELADFFGVEISEI